MHSSDVKKLTQRELRRFLPEGFTFKKRPWKCQLVSFVLGCTNKGYNFWLDLGLGKSKVAIDLCRFIKKYHNKKAKFLVCCVNDAATGNWAEQIAIHSNMKSVILTGTLDEKEEAFLSMDSGFYIIHYPGLRVMYSDLKKDNRIKAKKDSKRRMINRTRIIHYGRFDAMILDEAHLVKNKKSLIFKIIFQLTKYKSLAGLYLLTGTPFGKTLLDLWAPYYLVDRGETFFSSISEYRTAYFEDRGFWGPKWAPTKKGEKRIKEKMFNKAVRYEENEAKDLPEKIYIQQKFRLSEAQQEYYESLINELPVEIKGKAFEAENKSIAFKQVVSGFLMRRADGSKKRVVKIFEENPKLDELLIPLIESVVDKSKIVIFHNFIVEGRMIEKALRKLRIKYASLRGEVKDKYEQYTKYRTDDKIRVMVAHPKSGGSSLDFVVGNYCVFYSNSSIIDRKQCEKRLHREGQRARRVFFYDFVGTGTVEETVLRDLQNQINTFSRIVDNKKLIRALRGRL